MVVIWSVLNEHPEMFIKHAAACEKAINTRQQKIIHEQWIEEFKKFTLKPWQQSIIDELIIPIHFSDSRSEKIIWIYDEHGGNGKSFLSAYLEFIYGAVSFPGSINKTNVLHRYNGETIIIFDIERSTTLKKFNFSKLEALISPSTYSGKSIYKPAPAGARICIFANVLPSINKLSFASWDIRELCDGKLSRIDPNIF